MDRITMTAEVGRTIMASTPSEALQDDSGWVRVCSVAELSPNEAVVAPTEHPIALFNVDGEFYAIDDTCTHAKSSLAEGYIENDTVECSLHFATFCIRTGAALTPPAVLSLKTYPVKLQSGEVFVRPHHPM